MSLSQLSQLLPLTEEDLQQVLSYASTLSKAEATTHFQNLLGDTPLAVDFISSFNSSRKEPSALAQHGSSMPALASGHSSAPGSDRETADGVPKPKKHQRKKKDNIHALQARKVEEYAAPSGIVYNKKDNDLDYLPVRPGGSAPGSSGPSRSSTPRAQSQSVQPPPKPAPSLGGYLISEVPKAKSKSNSSSRSSTPKPQPTKVSLTGGTPMAGQSTALSDLDAAIRALEITTNPTLDSSSPADLAARRCNCVATRHPLQAAAPNCLSCGKVICLKEGLGPCTYCGAALLKPEDVQLMIRELKEERGREKMAANAGANRRADVSKTPLPFHAARSAPSNVLSGEGLASAEAKAREHRDKLLGFQAQNAQRTTIRDEAADFDATPSGGNIWASPEERARELKRQQKIMREMEWNARPDYEKRQQVLSIDLVGGKVVRKMVNVERPPSPQEPEPEASNETGPVLTERSGNAGGAFSRNPLLGGLIKPVFEVDEKGKGKELEGRKDKKGWRRVQMDIDDNEGVILDGGVYGHSGGGNKRGDEPDCG